MSPQCAVSGMGNGVFVQASSWARGLRQLGHEVNFVGPREDGGFEAIGDKDVIHFFQHGFWLKPFIKRNSAQLWCFSPILDSTASIKLYSLLARLPLDRRLISFGPKLLNEFCCQCTVVVRSNYELSYIEKIAPNAKVETVPIAISIDDVVAEAPIRELPQRFALFVGGVFAERKNVVRLIKACEHIRMPLVLVGNEFDTDYMRRVNATIEQASVPVVRLGFVSKAELRWLYGNCSVFCLPSLIEGVGQVVLEALHCGAPVVTTEIGGPRDYFGENVEYANPFDTKSIVSCIEKAILEPPSPNSVAKMLSQYSAEETAKKLLRCYLGG